MKRILLSLITCCWMISVYGQTQPNLLNPSFQGLYHVNSMEELKHTGLMQLSFTPTPPPIGVVRHIAEFNRMSGVLITYRNGFGIPYALITEMSQDALVYTLVTGLAQENTVRNLYTNNGVNLSHCRFIYAATDSYWTRDYGPWYIATDGGEVAIVDFPYNRPRPNDDNIPGVVANVLGINRYGMNLIHTGGNYMTDGMGIAASTTLVGTENPLLTGSQINQLVLDYLGIHTYHLNNDPLGQYIQHIDCWGKFLDVDKILITEVPTSNPQYADYEAVASYYATSTSSYGTPFQVFRVYSPNGQPYTNSLILNDKVLVPIASGTTASQWNASALAVYQQAMPGYEVIGVIQSNQAPWQTTDALHCRTKGMADIRPLYIHHIPLSGNINAQPSFEIRAHIQAYSDSGLVADSVLVAYQVSGGVWDSIPMLPDTGFTWIASIPGQINGSLISYVIIAKDSTGRKEMHPFIGHEDPHVFTVSGNVGLETEIHRRLNIMVYPNPSSLYSFVKFHNMREGSIELIVTDVSGRKMQYRREHGLGGEHFWKLDVSTWANGTYFITVRTQWGSSSAKLLVVN